MLYNKLLENIFLPLGDMATGGKFIKNLRRYRKEQWLSAEELDKLQQERLRKLLSFANEKLPFYKGITLDLNNDPREEIKKFPVMRKDIIKANIDGLVSQDKSTLIREASSGSSGIQGVVYLNKDAQSVQRSIQILWWEWAGYKMGNKLLQTGITPNRRFIKAIKDKVFRTHYISAYNLDTKDVINTLKDCEMHPRKHFMGYASSLFVYAQAAKDNNINDIRFDSVVSWGDKLFPHFRELIEKQFHTRVQDTYACTEGCMMAAQCDKLTYHIFTPQVFIEILDDDGNRVPNGQMGKVVVTRLDNYAMPLIRYYLGDLAILEDDPKDCSCGRHLPQLKKVIGRDTDIVKTRSGKFMVVHAFTGIFEHVPEIKQFRVIQHDLDSIDIECIPDNGYSETVLNAVRKKIHDYLHEEFPVNFTEVDVIPPTKSGKPQIIQSFLKQSIPA